MPILREIKEFIATSLFGDVIERAVASAVSVRVDDSPGWDALTRRGPADRPWSELAEDVTDALKAWRKNFFVRRLVTLTRSYVVGNGIAVTSKLPEVDEFIHEFWSHDKNRLDRRLGPMCNELTRAGELFPVLFTNKVDGMSYIRFVPASQIREIKTDEDDYEAELEYGQMQYTTTELKWWIGIDHPNAYKPRYRKLSPLMLHFAVNRPIGATRGEGDLGTVLPWAKRYSEWLKDRVRLNRRRTRQGVLDVTINDDTMVEEKRRQLATSNPLDHGIYVHGPGESVAMHNLAIDARDAKEDGKALRLAVVTGANVALHYIGEGEGTNYATAQEMGEPTARFYTDRQTQLCTFLGDLVKAAYKRKVALGKAQPLKDLQLVTSVAEVARADNESLAKAARDVVGALCDMKEQGWIDDATAMRIAFKFTGETLTEDEIKYILSQKDESHDTEQDVDDVEDTE